MIGSLVGIGSISAFLVAKKLSPLPKRGKHLIFTGFMIALVLILYTVSYRWSQPIHYYGEASDYGVFFIDGSD